MGVMERLVSFRYQQLHGSRLLQPVVHSVLIEKNSDIRISWLPIPPEESEDCLYHNVYAPADASPANRKAVLFWIFGVSSGCKCSLEALID